MNMVEPYDYWKEPLWCCQWKVILVNVAKLGIEAGAKVVPVSHKE